MNRRITTRFSASEVRLLRRAARARGLGVSELIRMLVLEVLRPQPIEAGA